MEQTIKTKYNVGEKVWVITTKAKELPKCETCGTIKYRISEMVSLVESSLIENIAVYIGTNAHWWRYDIKKSYGRDLSVSEEDIYATRKEAQKALDKKNK